MEMEFLSFLVFSLLLLVVIHGLIRLTSNLLGHKTLPPGPISLPLVGNLFQIGNKPHRSLTELGKKHGPLMTIRLGCVTTVVVSSPEMAREILEKNDKVFLGRNVPNAVTGQADYDQSLIWMPTGRQWQILRRALSTHLTNPQKLDALGGVRRQAVEKMVQHLKEVSVRGDAVDIGRLAFLTDLNQMSNACLSVDVVDVKSNSNSNSNDVVVEGFHKAMRTLVEVAAQFNVADHFPWLKTLDPQGLRRKAKTAYDWFHAFFDGYIDQRLQHRESNLQRHGDLLDSFLDYSQECDESEFNRVHIKILLMDLFIAGIDTASNTIEWAMTELLLQPSKMATLQREIIKKVGMEGRIDESEVLALPYLQALVKETLRMHVATPLLPPRKADANVGLNGHIIPKHTLVTINAWAIAHDPNLWEKPDCFMPERFLGSEVDFKGRHFSFLPFGSGRRICPGIPLAHRIVSLIIASLVQQFDWKLPPGMTPDKIDMSEIFATSLQKAVPLLAIPVPFSAEFINSCTK